MRVVDFDLVLFGLRALCYKGLLYNKVSQLYLESIACVKAMKLLKKYFCVWLGQEFWSP